MTYEDAKYVMSNDPTLSPPWAEMPGNFLIQVKPSGLVDPIHGHYSGIMAAIVHARTAWPALPSHCILRVTSADGSEVYQGRLRK